MSVWDQFKQIRAKIDHIRPDGVGYVKSSGDLIEIGEINSARGIEVDVAIVSETHGVCLTKSAVAGSYDKYEQKMIERYNIKDELENNHTTSDEEGLNPGEEFSAKVIDINSSGVGKVEDPYENSLKIGPISCEVGHEVQLEFVCEGYARCLDESVQSKNYENRFNILAGKHDLVPISIDEEYTGEVIQTHSSNSTVSLNGVHVHLQKEELSIGDKVVIRVTGFASQSALGEFIETKEDINSDSSPNQPSESHDLQNLRQQAKQQSRDSVDVSQTQTTVKQYSRSSTVRKYAKARADGVCEGCGSSAPFLDQDGDPYLQVHHLEELSNGGADVPENVACLCPNCHYRIHHGRDGEEFNKQVAAQIDSIEN